MRLVYMAAEMVHTNILPVQAVLQHLPEGCPFLGTAVRSTKGMWVVCSEFFQGAIPLGLDSFEEYIDGWDKASVNGVMGVYQGRKYRV